MRRLPILLAAVTLAAGLQAAPVRAAGEALWRGLAEGRLVALMRHAEAPGTGDPPGFRLGDCATQRNLDAGGRAQARATGALFRARGIERARVFTSQWCRCRETAELLGLGPVEELPALNSFISDRARRGPQSEATLAFLADLPAGTPVVLVTHQVNITALTDVFPRSGEIVVVRQRRGGPEDGDPGDGGPENGGPEVLGLEVVGRLGPAE